MFSLLCNPNSMANCFYTLHFSVIQPFIRSINSRMSSLCTLKTMLLFTRQLRVSNGRAIGLEGKRGEMGREKWERSTHSDFRTSASFKRFKSWRAWGVNFRQAYHHKIKIFIYVLFALIPYTQIIRFFHILRRISSIHLASTWNFLLTSFFAVCI